MTTNHEVADVLVIGSGASGGALAWRMSHVPGIRVVCLEQGDWIQEPRFSTTTDMDRERRRLVSRPGPAGIKYSADGYPFDHSESEWTPSMENAVGGSTVHWGGLFSRLHPSDFRVRTIDGVAEDWPISYRDLEPYYDLNDRMMGVAGLAGNPSGPPRSQRQMRPHPVGLAGQVLVRGFEQLGWHWWPADAAINTEPYGNGRQACSGYCFSCNDACYRNAKARTDIVYWPEAISNGVVLKTRARVREITVNKQGLADGALFYDSQGQLQEQKARNVVLACNGLGTPRLMLVSVSALFPQGLANSSGLVGKHLMCHPTGSVVGIFEEELDAYMGPRANSLISEEFYESDSQRGFVRGHSWICGRNLVEPVGTALGSSSGASAAGGTPSGSATPWGEGHHGAFKELFNHMLGISALGDDLPDEGNRLVLDPTLTDDMGIPAPKLLVKRGENTRRLIEHSVERQKELLDAAGAKRILRVSQGGGANGHYLGTARMGNHPKTSVVDGWGRCHDVKNLFIIDGSVFVTSGTVTPTSTIQAIALRTADYIKDNAGNLPG